MMEREGQGIETSRDATLFGVPGADATAAAVAAMEARLNERGPQAALAFLNARTRYRFTGIYHADPPLLRNMFLFDRENPALRAATGPVCPIDETYCGIVVADEAEFATGDATLDARLTAHPAREAVISYAGVPLRLASGRPWGTLCHFDVRPRLLLGRELAVLQAAAPVLMRWLRARAPSGSARSSA